MYSGLNGINFPCISRISNKMLLNSLISIGTYIGLENSKNLYPDLTISNGITARIRDFLLLIYEFSTTLLYRKAISVPLSNVALTTGF